MTSELERRTLRLGTEALYRDGRFYDQLYRRRQHDVAFYVEVARAYAGKRGPILEIGVGTGRVAAALARNGFDVVGIDTMRPMLDQARARLAKLPRSVGTRVHLRRADIRRFRSTDRFPLVIAPFNMMQHLYARHDIERGLATCRAQLRARGRFVFDVLLPDLAALQRSPGRLLKGRPVTHPADGKRYNYYEASHYDVRTQVRTIHMVLEDPQEPRRRHAIPLSHRQFFPAELDALLSANGFAVEHVYGDFARGELLAASESQVYIAKQASRG